MNQLVTQPIEDGQYVDVGKSDQKGIDIEMFAVGIHNMEATVKKITTTEDGSIQIVIESKILDAENLSKAKELLGLQRSGNVRVSIQPIQHDLFSA